MLPITHAAHSQYGRYTAIQPGFPRHAEPPLINLTQSKGGVSAAASPLLREEVSLGAGSCL